MRALGRDAGRLAATGNGNVYIGAGMTGVQGEKGKKEEKGVSPHY